MKASRLDRRVKKEAKLLLKQARKIARRPRDAGGPTRAKAEQLAGLAGRTLGAVEEITEREEGAGGPIMPVRMADAEAAPRSFDAGEQEVSVSVTVRWAWA